MPIPRMIRNCRDYAWISLFCIPWQNLNAAEPNESDLSQPVVAPASSEGAESMLGIQLHDQWEVNLYAAEPDVANIVSFDVDNRGRVFVCESFRQDRGITDNRNHDETWLLADLASETVQDRIDYHKRLLGDVAATYSQQEDRIRRLVDSDGDGKADISTLLANGFHRLEEGTGAGVLVRGNDIFFTCIPKLWKLTDDDDDGQADRRKAMSDGYGVKVAFRGHDLHGLLVGPDGRLYFSIGDRGYHVVTEDGRELTDPSSGAVFRCELDGSDLEVFATGMRNPQELAFNDIGDLFSVDNNSDSGDRARIIHILEDGDTGWRMHYQYLPDRGPFNRERIWEPFHDEQPAYIVPPIANFSDGPSGLAYYPGTGFGDQLKNKFLLCDFRGTPAKSGVRTFVLEPDGAFYSLSTNQRPIWSVLATDVAFSPDGSLLISDWVDGWNGVGKGRLYRVTDPRHDQSPIVKEVFRLLSGDWATYTNEKLSNNLAHADRRVRFESQWELARRGDLKLLLNVAIESKGNSTERLHAIWGVDQIARLDTNQRQNATSALSVLLDNDDAILRAAAAKVMGERSNGSAIKKIRTLLSDRSPRVRYFAAISLAKLNDQESLSAIVRLLDDNGNNDPAIRHAGVTFLANINDPQRIVALADHKSESVRRAAVVAMRRAKHGDIAKFLSDKSRLVVLEAARAIHDVPIPVAMPSLAELIEGTNEDKGLIRRALNANYRMGGDEAAERIVMYASRDSAPLDMRLEALDMLADWNPTDPRDRVLGAHRPLPKRDPKPAAVAMELQIDRLLTCETSIREKATLIAADLGIKKIVPQIIARFKEAKLTPQDRANALLALARLDSATALRFANSVKLRPANALTIATVQVMADIDIDGSVATFMVATDSRNAQLRQLAWDTLANCESDESSVAIAAGVEEYLNGTLLVRLSQKKVLLLAR